jgi:hypothetical protein
MKKITGILAGTSEEEKSDKPSGDERIKDVSDYFQASDIAEFKNEIKSFHIKHNIDFKKTQNMAVSDDLTKITTYFATEIGVTKKELFNYAIFKLLQEYKPKSQVLQMFLK